MPASRKVQRSLGPSFGHVLRRPVSLDTSVRSGPRHWGQSAAAASPAATRRPGASQGSVFFIRIPRRFGRVGDPIPGGKAGGGGRGHPGGGHVIPPGYTPRPPPPSGGNGGPPPLRAE